MWNVRASGRNYIYSKANNNKLNLQKHIYTADRKTCKLCVKLETNYKLVVMVSGIAKLQKVPDMCK